MRKITSGFTIVELLVVITIIGILSTIGVLSYSQIQANTRDSQRSTKMTILAEALEKFYDKNGEYPSCYAMAQTPSTVSTTTLSGLDPTVLKTPSAADGTNSILPLCADLSTGTDAIAYIGDGSNACTSISSPKDCLEWTLKYREEATGNIISVTSRRNIAASNAGNISDLAVSNTSFVQVGLTWVEIGNAINYNIQKATNSAFTANMTESTVASNTATVTGLSMNVKYYFRVRSNFTSGSGNWSNVANTTTLNLATPVATAAANSTSQITVNWNAVTNATSYNVDMSTSSSFTSPTSVTGIVATNRAFTGLAANTTYYFRVLASASGESSSWSATASTATSHLATPTITVTVNSSTQITVSWPAITYATAYGYHGSKAASFSSLIYANTTASISQVFTGLSQGTTYYFRVYAGNANDTGSWSGTVAGTTGVDAPAAPSVSAYLAGGWAYGSAGAVGCPAGTTAYYEVAYNTNDGGWTWPGWTGSLVATGTTQGYKYGYITYAYCQGPNAASGAAGGNYAEVVIPIAAPATPGVTANTAGATTTWSWGAVSCPGNTARYQYNYVIDYSGGYTSVWYNTAGLLSTYNTSSVGYQYTSQVQAQCYSAFTTSSWSATGQASYARPVASPGPITFSISKRSSTEIWLTAASSCTSGSYLEMRVDLWIVSPWLWSYSMLTGWYSSGGVWRVDTFTYYGSSSNYSFTDGAASQPGAPWYIAAEMRCKNYTTGLTSASTGRVESSVLYTP